MPLDDTRIARGNSKLSADYKNAETRNVMFCCNGADEVGHTLEVGKVSTAGAEQLALIVTNKKGERISPPARGDSEPLITIRTPLSKLGPTYETDISRIFWDPVGGMSPSSAVHLTAAGNADEWAKRMSHITDKLARSYALAVRKHGTLIPNDKSTASWVKKNEGKTDDEFAAAFIEEMLYTAGHPHMSHATAHLMEGSPLVFRSPFYKKAEKNIQTPFDEYIDPDKLAAMRDMHPGRVAPIPIYIGKDLVSPEEYCSIAARLPGSTAYLVLWAKMFSNSRNRVQSLKFGIDKIVVAELGPVKTNASSGVVDLFADDTAEPEPEAAAVVDVLDLAADAGEDTGRAAKRQKRTAAK